MFFLPSVLLTACYHDADEYAIKGIDISHYQQSINWAQLTKSNKVDFVFIKATESVDYQDSLFQEHWENASKFNLIKGAYHFFRPTVSVNWQIKNFTAQVTLKQGDLPPVLDIEDTKQVTMPQLIDRASKWLIFIEDYYGIRPIIYASMDLYQKHLKEAFPDHIVWIARYNTIKPPKTLDWKFWQYNDKHTMIGIRGKVDQNVFVGTLKELKELCIQ